MQISTRAWIEYIQKMSMISEEASNKMQQWIAVNGFADDKALLDYAFALSQHYGDAISALACEMYDKTADAQNANVEKAEPIELPTYGEIARAIHGAKKKSEKEVPRATARIVKQAGADTTLKNAGRDKAQCAWVPFGDTCAFCIMLASRGWEDADSRNYHAKHIHANCDCQYAVRFDKKSGVKGYDPQKYLDMYNGADPTGSSQDKINAMRRMMKKQNVLLPETLKLEDFAERKSVGAKTRSYDIIDKASKITYHLVEGTKFKNVEVFAGKGVRNKLDPLVAEGVAKELGGKAKDIQHVKGIGYLQDENYEELPAWAEVHWFQVQGGKKDKFVIKYWLEDQEEYDEG